MTFRIATELVEAIVAEAAASPGVEVCGLLLGRGEVVEQVRPCRNVADDPSRRFEIDPAALLTAHRQARAGGPAILGCYHSHPSGNAEPSAKDAADAAPNGWLWIVATVTEAKAWRAVENGILHARFEQMALSNETSGAGGKQA